MSSATITSKGQLTLPKAIRERLDVGPGDRVDFIVDEEGRVVVEPASMDLRTMRGAVKSSRRGVTLEDMEEAIRAGGQQR